MDKSLDDYYRCDQKSGITPPNLANECTFPEHIVHARGKRMYFTSVSLDSDKIRFFGSALYKVLRKELLTDRHSLIEHQELLRKLGEFVRGGNRKQKDLALRAIPRAKRTREGLIKWNFTLPSSLEIKELIDWTREQIQKYFERMS